MPTRKIRRRKSRPAESTDADNTILYLVGGIASVAGVLAATGLALTLYERFKSKDEEETPKKKAKTLELKSLQERIEKACTEILTKQLKQDTAESKALRELCDSLDLEAEDVECRIALARFLRWRTSYIEGADLPTEFRAVTKLLNFPLEDLDDAMIGNWLRSKFDLALASKNLVELSRVRKVLKTLSPPTKIEELSHTMYYQVAFKLACIFGDWEGIQKYGEEVAGLSSVRNNPMTGRRESVPLLHTYSTEANKDPEKNPNWYTMFLRRKMFKTRFQSIYQSQLQFLHWDLISGRTKYANGQTNIQSFQEQLDAKKNEGWKTLNCQHQDLWISGSMCQMKMKTAEDGICVLTGPWNDAEMCLVGLMFYMVKGKPLRIETTLQVERGEFLAQGASGRNKGAWQWTGQLIIERHIQTQNALSAQDYTLLSQEVHDIELVLDDH